MPFDGTEIDLSKPTCAGLSYLLRHKELWPATFKKWDYADSRTCAIGLALHQWMGMTTDDIAFTVKHEPTLYARLGLNDPYQVFGELRDRDGSRRTVTPEQVADALDRVSTTT